MGTTALRKEPFYTYADYLNWDGNERWEIIEGTPYNMSPTPTLRHQEILGNLFLAFAAYLKDKKCKVYSAPVDVLLPKKGETKKKTSNVVQPDIVVICEQDKIKDGDVCFGSPDLIIEILSPSTGKKDLNQKFKLYEEHGVFEYWIVDPANQVISRFHLKNNEYGKPEYFHLDDTISPLIFPENDLEIKLEDVFPIMKKDENE